LPIISEIKEVPGLFVATGHGGNGITLGPITGLLLSEMILGRPPSLPVGLFDLHRFSRANAESE
jgi:sarcosine oxidase subunit beta